MRYRNRTEAGIALVDPLRDAGFGESERALAVLGVARGGVAVAAPVARAFGTPLGVVIARKLRAPRNPELAIGAVGSGGEAYVDEWLMQRLQVSGDYLSAEIVRQRAEIDDRAKRYGAVLVDQMTEGSDVVVVDDGVATGATLIAALRSVAATGPSRLICAVPVGPPDTLERLSDEADVVVCPVRPARFAAVGEWYEDFTQTTDAAVMALLERTDG